MNLLGDILDTAMQTRDLVAFRHQVLQILSPLGFDEGSFASMDPEQPLEDNGFVHGPGSRSDTVLREIHAREAFLYRDLAAYFAHTYTHGVTRDDDPMSYSEFRRTTAFYNDIYRPAGFARFVNTWITPPGKSPAIIALVRTSPTSGFARRDTDVLQSLRSGLALAEGALRRPRFSRALDGVMRPGDRQLVELLVLGYTNKQIAQVLQRSPNTIRNRLISLYVRAGVASRTELIGLMSRPEQ